jgi:hypothetical protein
VYRFNIFKSLCPVVDALIASARTCGIDILYDSRAVSLVHDAAGVHGGHVRQLDSTITIGAKAVVLASSGFEANTEWRTRYLGPGWDLAKVRGSRFNMGDGIRMALDIGAQPYGNWSGATPLVGTAMRPSSATSRSAIISRSTPIPGASWSTPPAGASSTRGPTFATTPTLNTER